MKNEKLVVSKSDHEINLNNPGRQKVKNKNLV